MKFNNPVSRSVFALLLGLALIVWPDLMQRYLVVIIGILFAVPGLISLISYLTYRKKSDDRSTIVPVESVGSLLFGLWLILMPDFFTRMLMYLLGLLLVIGAVQQIYSLVMARRQIAVPLLFFLFPAITLIAGLIILFNPMESIASMIMLFGIMAVFYGVNELFNYFRFKKRV